jgi:hypothetical protein
MLVLKRLTKDIQSIKPSFKMDFPLLKESASHREQQKVDNTEVYEK